MSQFWSPIVHDLTPYVPGEQPTAPAVIKLNTNECPYGPSPEVCKAIRDAIGKELRLYPDPKALELRGLIAETYGLHPAEVFVGNGSDEVLAHAFRALLGHDGPLLFPDVTYGFYRSYCSLYSISFREVPLDPCLRIIVEDYVGPCGAIILANPNAPTGIPLPVSEIERLVAAHPARSSSSTRRM